MDSIKNVDLQELECYSMFLNQKVRNNDSMFTIYQISLIPFMIGLVSCVISFAFGIFENSDTFKLTINKALFPVCLLVLLWFIVHTIKEMISVADRLSYKYFYQDIKEIVDERMEKLKSCAKVK